MKKLLLLFILILPLQLGLYSQDSGLADIFKRNFEKGNMNIKYQVLQDAVDMGIDGMESLFIEAITYVLNNIDQVDREDTLVRIADITIRQIHSMNYTQALDRMWKLFIGISHTELKINILLAFGDMGKDNPSLIDKMNKWLNSRNDIFLTGRTQDIQVIIACIQALGKIGDSSSFLPIFTAMVLKYSALVNSTAQQALSLIKGDIPRLYMGVIMEGRYAEKKEALFYSLKAANLSDEQKCRVAEFALNSALHSSPGEPEDKLILLEIRYIAVNFLGEKNWTQGTDLVIEHFNQAVFDYDNRRVEKSYLLKAIQGLGNMKSHEAAKRLTLYLELINSFTENDKIYDEQIVLSVIYALSTLGDRTASAALLYTKYLDYSSNVKQAAQDALRELR
ncbi:MAG: hypothetical protein JXJ04_00980 [Spirochaetales bacterium]|nr:hypothetical protein [Spirochaetales bacterium]